MERVPKVPSGTYDGRPFELIQRLIHFGGSKSTRQIKSYLLRFENGDVEYVLDYDPLLKFDPINVED